MPDEVAKYQGPFLQETFNITADLSPLFLEARLPVCPTPPNKPTCSSPHDANRILLFSPGYSIPRLYYNTLAASIASQGFTVITIDHPFDANIILYPPATNTHTNHTTIHTNTSIISHPTWDLHPRAADASFLPHPAVQRHRHGPPSSRTAAPATSPPTVSPCWGIRQAVRP
ncbi:hypothetical protein CHGG_02033 [Chaetomium globosum CBS 148.51]|uniref:Uncharacterized protein n=1 Tax=Chaetomium globosum (strain ATCC 6205 / CBS 148.51 / DSM 1962 / NBRC 6347 / NRRL 1970) TaxID=306901 RepID=Q2HCM1_CHAGB|nr:uncharacterized protein CHGG_02033 [Chaetomium globosum CBS 148.51]EAQ93798.1 hypothetical protein CHGG_02033 [Chaetomium globosum CBS 148.51]